MFLFREVHTPATEKFKEKSSKEKCIDYNKLGYVEGSKNCGIKDTNVVETTSEIPECHLQVPGHPFQMPLEKEKSGDVFTSDPSRIPQERKILSEVPSSSLTSLISPNSLHINNIILKQNSEKRVLTFVPVHLAVSEQIPNKPLHSRVAADCSHSLPVLLSSTIASYKLSMQTENDSSLLKLQNCKTINTQNAFEKTNQVVQTNCQDIEGTTNTNNIFSEQGFTSCTSMDGEAACVFDVKVLSQQSRTNDALLQEVVHLIQEEFAFDGYLENGVEVFDMGMFIFFLYYITDM